MNEKNCSLCEYGEVVTVRRGRTHRHVIRCLKGLDTARSGCAAFLPSPGKILARDQREAARQEALRRERRKKLAGFIAVVVLIVVVAVVIVIATR
ncbi:MAG: hypothetical protein LBM78_00145 [Clostridiales bacterium]|jgi:hypothetical protein|nr:hypothetical protein [Clostridiales bacterium]